MRRSLRTTAYVVTTCAAMLAPASARAQAPPVAAPVPVATTLQCADGCGAAGAARSGSLLRVRGKALSRAAEVVFLGAPGEEDDVAAATTVRRRASADVRVPVGAVPGPVAVVDRDGTASAPTSAPLTLDTSPPAALRSTAPTVEFSATAPRAYYDAAAPAGARLRRARRRAANVAIDLCGSLTGR